MQTNIKVREARHSDLEVLLQFEQEIISAERPFDSTLKEGLIHYYDLRMMLQQPEVKIAVAEANGSIIASGYARIETAKSYLKHKQHAYLGFMYVLPEYRGQGIIQIIISYLSDFAKCNDVSELRLDVFAGNDKAVSAYEKAGFRKLLIEMEKHI